MHKIVKMLANSLSILNGKAKVISSVELNPIFSDHYAYEVIRLIHSKVLFLDLHFERLVKSCEALGYPPLEKSILLEELELLIRENHLQDINIKIMIRQEQRILFPIKSHYPAEEDYLRGVTCSLLFVERDNPSIKVHQELLRKKSNEQIQSKEIYESVLVNKEGKITEGSRSNLFFIKEDTIYTAPDALVLGGITRLKVIEIIQKLGLELKMDAISLDDLANCQAAFICGTSPGVLAIQNIEEIPFNVEHPMLLKIHQAYHQSYLEI